MLKINTLEEFKKVQSHYYVCTCGKIISTHYSKLRILKSSKNREDGYKQVSLRTIDNNDITIKIHRLVAIAFVLNEDPVNNIYVNHLDEDKNNNCSVNLEWVTAKHNINYGTRGQRASISISKSNKNNPKLMGKNNHKSKPFEYYESISTIRSNFKRTCNRQGWDFNDIEEIFAEWGYDINKDQRYRKYFYKFKGEN